MISQNLPRHHLQDENNKQYVHWLITFTGSDMLWGTEKHDFQIVTVQYVCILIGDKH